MKPKEQTAQQAWQKIQDEFAEREGAAVILVGENSSELAISNNNSMCRFLYESAEFAPRCAEFCGRAFETAFEAGEAVHVKCHADLNFFTVPIETKERKLAAIVGRAFLKTEDYRRATNRAVSGDWRQFPATEFFAGAFVSASIYELEGAAEQFEKLSRKKTEILSEAFREKPPIADEKPAENEKTEKTVKTSEENLKSDTPAAPVSPNGDQPEAGRNGAGIAEIARWRALFGSMLDLSYGEACSSVLKFLANRYALKDAAWLERKSNRLEVVFAAGDLQNRQIKIGIAADDERISEAAVRETALTLRERQTGEASEPLTIQMFPVAIGGETRGALVAGGEIGDESVKKHVARFVQMVASELEILRLREELGRQSTLSKAVRKFNENLKNIDAENFWDFVAQISVELMRAERGSLLAFDEAAQKFVVKAAIGSRADVIREEKENLGVKLAQKVFETGAPLIVKDIEATEIAPAPDGWKYKTKSFLSYPITIGGRKIGVFSVTDKIDGGVYDASDLALLDAFAPQLAVALDRTSLKKKAGEFEQLSITDSLTGLPNRRYLEERLAEEINRSERYGYPLSFMMLDVDEFKSYNDQFTHPEGDKALKIVGQIMKETLRGADVAARYGGEEFSILLPQTNVQKAHTIAERIREKVESRKFPNRKVTVSIGIATCSPHLCSPEKLIKAADEALYRAKNSGRNNVRISDEIE